MGTAMWLLLMKRKAKRSELSCRLESYSEDI